MHIQKSLYFHPEKDVLVLNTGYERRDVMMFIASANEEKAKGRNKEEKMTNSKHSLASNSSVLIGSKFMKL